jgi:F420-dependent oxidoreductase-like protein
MKVGLQVPSFTWPGGDAAIGRTLGAIGRTADEQGFDSLWVMDHFFQIEFMGLPTDDPMLEGYTALSFVAGQTERITLGTLVTGVVYRPPGLLAKTVTTLDVLSGGRAWLGIGAAWFEREAHGLGFGFPGQRERYERLEETLQIVKQMWAGDRAPYEGSQFRLEEPINSPQALTKPHPPILIGGGGEKRTLRLVAQYADACNLFSHIGADALRHKLDVLERHCAEIGRDSAEIQRTILMASDPRRAPAELVAECRTFAELGFQHVIISNVAGVHELVPLELIGREVIPALREL